MTKTLTEQWREGTLPEGWYYVKTPCEEIKKLYCGDGESLELEDPETAGYYFFHRDLNKGQVEVLSPVPDYYDCKGLVYDSIYMDKARIKVYELVSKNEQLEKKLEIATKALKEFKKNEDNYLDFGLTSSGKEVKLNPNRVATKALKEMEGVK